MKKCLMIQTKDRKKFFTHERNLIELIEFSKIFNAEISTVQIPNEEIVLDLEELAPALCEKKQSKQKQYEVLEVQIKTGHKRNKNISRSSKIKKHIEQSLLNGQVVSLCDLIDKYKSYKLTTACLCNHFKKTRENMEKEGYQIVKVGGGKYKIENQ